MALDDIASVVFPASPGRGLEQIYLETLLRP